MNFNSVSNYASQRDDFLKSYENPFLAAGNPGYTITHNGVVHNFSYLNPYYDGSIAIGYGYDLLVHTEAQINTEFAAVGGTITAQGHALLAQARTNLSLNEDYYEDIGQRITLLTQLANEISLPGEPNASNLMGRLLQQEFEPSFDTTVLPHSSERIAIISYMYNFGTGGILSTRRAILNNQGDPTQRAKIWYEIRFNSGHESSARRVAESNLFGLYDSAGGPSSSIEAKAVVYFLESRRGLIEQYINNDDVLSLSHLETGLNVATQYLIDEFGMGASIQDVIVGVGQNYEDYFGNQLPIGDASLQGDGDNELIFGQDGGDTINGNGGDDVLYGGDDNDTITGGEGRDILLGEDGDDTLISGVATDNLVDSENDRLEGGEGFDTYHAGNGDVITDSDGEGRVFFGDIELTGGRLSMDGQVYYSEDGQVIYSVQWGATPDEPTTLRVTTTAGTIEILDYYKDDLGIELRGEDGDDNGPPLPPRPQGGGDPQPMSPIALDLNGDGLQTTALQDGVYFDLDTDGFAEKIGYLNPNDGFLALDRNGDGRITSGSEMFGNNTPMLNGSIATNGYAALKSYDSNGDNLIDSNDAIYAGLRVWRDTNMDGISRESELHTLSELGVEAIGVSYTNSTLTDNGNELRQLGLYRTADGELRQTADIWFQTDVGDQLENKLPLTPEIMALPDTAAFGRAPSLRQAILTDTSGELQTLVENVIQPGLDHNQRITQIEKILFKMTGQQEEFGLNPENSLLLDVRIIGTLEAYYNQRLQDAMYTTGTGYLNWYSLRFEQLLNSTFSQLASQTFLSQYFDVMTFNYDADRNLVGTDFHQAIINVLNDATANPATANDLIFDFVRAVRGINPYEEPVFEDFQADFAEVVAGGAFAPELTSIFENAFETFHNTLGFASNIDTTDADDVLQGTFGNDHIDTYGGNDEIHGGRGIDTINAGAGDDVLDGGMDRDTLTGGAGSDVYIWGRDYGQDQIIQTGGATGDVDVVQFTADVVPADLRVWRWGGDLVIGINGTSDTLSIKDWFSPNNRITSLEFTNGTVWTPAQAEALANTATAYNDYLTGTAGDDVIQSLAGDDIIVGGAGNDSLSGGTGNDHLQSDAGDDYLYGEEGDDRLYGGAGNDILDGGADNDKLDGGAGNDTYRFGRGSGADSIENRFDNTDFDTIEMAADILPADILVSRQNNDLILTISGTQDTLRIQHWYHSPDYRVDQVVFNNGIIWDIAQLEAFINQGTAGNDIITGTAVADVLDGLAGNDTISGLDGDDELHGNTGSDTLKGGNGNDVLLGEAGNDVLNGDAGDDTLNGGAGSDQLYGGAGNDTYWFGRGSGSDQISEPAGSGADIDIIRIADDVLPADIRVQRIHSGLRLVIRDTGDTLSVSGWYSSPDYQIQQVVFGDGTIWTPAQLETMAAVISDEDDYVFGDTTDNTLSGLGGNDSVYGAEGNDTLSGGTGNDYIQGDAGNDSLLGEAGNDTLYGAAGNDTLDGGEGDDQLRGEAGQDTLLGGAGTDTLYAGAENDVLEGGSGDDKLYGEHGSDTLTGGAGNDRLEGGIGNDTYYFGPGDGQDQIFENDSAASNIDTIRMTGVLPADIDVTRVGESSFVLHIRGTGDQLTVLSGLSSGNHKVEQVIFDDGTTWDSAQLEALSALPTDNNDTLWANQGNPLHGLGGNDYLYAHVTGSELHGDGGNDSLMGNSAADSLYGGSGDDALYGQAGNDVLDGGAGNDRLEGGTGNDNYRFGQGYGQDTIVDNDNTAFNQDSVILDEELAPADVRVRFVNTQLTLFIEGSDDRLTLGGGIERVMFNDGTIWTQNDLYALARTGSAESDELRGSSGNDTMDGLAGNDSIYGQDGDDTLSGGAGNDYIRGDAGNDALHGQEGDDELHGFFGNDTIEGGSGNDLLYGSEGNDELVGGEGADSLYGEGSDDELDGGAGNDRLEGGSGNDTYWLRRGSGHDVLQESQGETDVIRMADDLIPSDIDVAINGYSLVLKVSDTGDSISIQNWVNNPQSRVEQVVFADGTIWDSAQLESMAILATEGNDDIYGTNNDENIDALAGNDIVRAGSGNDVLIGGAGSDSLFGEIGNDILSGGDGLDTLIGGEGNDELDGGAGNDWLYGDGGSDKYHFSRGGGNDRIEEKGAIGPSDIDTVQVANDILPSELSVRRENGNLKLSLSDGLSSLLIVGWYLDSKNKIEQVVFDDGTVWSAAQLELIANTPTEGNDALYGTNGDDSIDALSGNDSINGGDGNDVLTGGAGNDGVHGENGNDVLYGGSGDDILHGGSGNDLLEGGDGYDNLYGGEGNDVLAGGAGNDMLNGDSGDDSLTGGSGLNTFRGGEGSDNYYFGVGSGSDQIVEQDNAGSAIDILQMGTGIALSDIRVTRNEHSLTLSIANTSDSITIHNWYGSEGNRIEQVVFEGGAIWSAEDLETMVSTATDGSDLLYGTAGDDTINALAGDDTVYAGAGNDVLVGGAGSDILHGEAGNDDLTGGAGNDNLYGGSGNDLYRYGRNEGSDLIVDEDSTPGNVDSIHLNSDILPGDVLITRNNNDLLLSIHGNTSGVLRIGGWFSGSQRQIEEVHFGNGAVWTATELENRIGLLTEHADSWWGTESADDIDGLGGDDLLVGFGGEDVLQGGDGNDQLFGSSGNDTLDGGSDDDRLEGGSGNDVLEGGAGDDYLLGGAGNDTYRFSVSDGRDEIFDNSGTDTVEFAAGINPADVVVTRDAFHVYLNVGSSASRLMLNGWFLHAPYDALQVTFVDGTIWDKADIMALIPTTTGTQYDDYIVGPDSGASLTGLGGSDRLFGGSGNDTLDGGTGTDSLNGGTGSDTYIFGYSSGEDELFDNGNDTDVDVIQLGAGIGTDDVTLTRDSGALYLSLNGTTDRLTVSNWFDEMPAYSIEQIVFSDGTVWGESEVQDHLTVQPGTESDDEIHGGNGPDNITGLGGDDSIFGYGGDDVIEGGSGNDYIDGLAGNDIIAGGAGNDELYGGSGNDRYDFGIGSGFDVVSDHGGEADAVYFGPGVTPGDIQIRRLGGYVELSIDGTDDRLALHWYGSPDFLIEQFVFDNGTVWSGADINPHYEGTEEDDYIDGDYRDDVLLGLGGNDVLNGGGGIDVINGGSGDDYISGEAGDDDLNGGSGEDYLEGGSGNDRYNFGLGSGIDGISDQGGEADVVYFGPGITSDDIEVRRGDGYLEMIIDGTGDQLIIYGESPEYLIEQFVFGDGTIWNGADINPPYEGTEDGEYLQGGDGDDVILGYGGDDILFAGAGDDLLDGGKGADWLMGGYGNDVYLFRRGDGSDTVINDSAPQDLDTLRFEDVLPNEVIVTREYSALVVSISGTDDRVVIDNWFSTPSQRLESVEFSGGTIWDAETLENSLVVASGTEEDDSIFGSGDAENISGLGGNDIIYGGGGADTLNGGTGDDALIGEQGNDTYLFNLGDGQDYIGEEDNTSGNIDTLRFGEGIEPEDVLVSQDSGSLYVEIAGTGDSIYINNWFQDGAYQIERFEFDDGTIWEVADIESQVEVPDGTASDEEIYGASRNDLLFGRYGDDTLYGHLGDDILIGGQNYDEYQGGKGSDVYVFNAGDIYSWDVEYVIDYEDAFPDASSTDTDTISLGGGLLPSDINAYLVVGSQESDGQESSWSSLFLQLGPDGGAIEIDWLSHYSDGQGYEENYDNRIERLQFIGLDDHLIFDLIGLVEARYDALVAGGDEETFVPLFTPEMLVEFDITATSGLAGGDAVYNYAITGDPFTAPPINGGAGDDTLTGTQGIDQIYGFAGNDTLQGLEGDDMLAGGTGDDTYVFNRGDGWDYIEEGDSTAGNIDTLQLGEGILPEDLVITRDGGELYIEIDGTNDGIHINQWFEDGAYQIERFEFDNGTVWDVADIESQFEIPIGTEEHEDFYGTSRDDLIYGQGGDDALYGYLGDDVLIGGFGTDDYQEANKGDDVYAFNPGDIDPWNVETIYGNYGEFGDSSGNDTISLGSGFSPSDVHAYLEVYSDQWEGQEWYSSTLYLQLGAGGGIIQIDWESLYSDGHGYEDNYDNRIERLQFIGLNDHQIFDLIGLIEARYDDLVEAWENETFIPLFTPETLTEFDITSTAELAGGDHAVNYALTGDPNLNLVSGSSGDDTLTGTSGNDKMEGLAGNDALYGLAGDDVYIFGVGAGQDTIEDYDTGTNTDTIRLDGVLPWNVAMSPHSNDPDDLLITFGTMDFLVVKNYFQAVGSEDYRIERFEFDNGVVWDGDFIFSGSDPDIIDVGDGNDVVYSGSGNDVIYGGAGNDFLYGQTLSDTLYGGDGDDYLHGGRANDFLYGGSGNDILQGLQGVDSLYGDSGDDILIYFGNDDSVLDGGEGIDLISFGSNFGGDGVTAVLQESGTNSFDVAIGSGSPTSYSNAVSIEGFIGSDYNDSLSGNSGDNVIYGDSGNDTFIGGTGSDVYRFGAGDDRDSITEDSGGVIDTQATDMVELTPGVAIDELWFTQEGDDLRIWIDGTDDWLQVDNWYSNSAPGIEQFETSTGDILLASEVQQLVDAMAVFDPSDSGVMNIPQTARDEVAPVIAAAWTQGGPI